MVHKNKCKQIYSCDNHASKCVVSYEKASKYKKEANSAVTSICWEVQKKGKRREKRKFRRELHIQLTKVNKLHPCIF